jgi:hypothetical protein
VKNASNDLTFDRAACGHFKSKDLKCFKSGYKKKATSIVSIEIRDFRPLEDKHSLIIIKLMASVFPVIVFGNFSNVTDVFTCLIIHFVLGVNDFILSLIPLLAYALRLMTYISCIIKTNTCLCNIIINMH